MIPGNVDPRRPDKVQRYKPTNSGSSNTSGEDLTPDYMNILGPESTTGNVQGDNTNENIKSTPAKPQPNQQQTVNVNDDASKSNKEAIPANITNASNVIPTSPQYGLAIIPTTSNDISTEVITPATDTIIETTAKTTESEIKDMHSTPSKNDRFKVVKIASSEPFRRGRWKCMDFVDQVPPATTIQQTKTSQGATNVQMAGNVYMQTQSLPPQQIQQLLLQGAFTTTQPPQFYQNNIQSQIVPQTPYFYPAVQNQGSTQQQMINTGAVVVPTSVQAQYINTTQQQYFQAPVIPQNYQNMQYQQAASYPNQNSAFVPTTQNVQSFQQGQTYSTQPPVTQAQTIPATQPQPMVNGFTYTTQTVTDQQIAPTNLPTQVAKNVILNSNTVTQVPTQPAPLQNQQQESQQNSVSRPVQSITEQNPATYQQLPPQNLNPVQPINQNVVVQPAKDVYTNPQFVSSMHTLPTGEGQEAQASEGAEASAEASSGNPDDPAKTNPVVNAIDNKIEQAMDLVKSHLMYTVREEVEVLKEKIAELMERIQQLESENNFLRSQIPKSNPNSNGPTEPSPQQ
ncbi:hypothetical protein RN001_000367 [Aquatica leii]|uniref:Protein Asterix n=1 Tax=Aquatica leii TaxID=1421715 RepID=A0AAN7PK16_9COLE|nr:hypothetical protein RN001_000367 [Aquatica leii]